jgi:hypothetical protein
MNNRVIIVKTKIKIKSRLKNIELNQQVLYKLKIINKCNYLMEIIVIIQCLNHKWIQILYKDKNKINKKI